MSKSMKLSNIYLYRMTHVDNVPHVLQYGITHKNSPNANPNFKDIGDVKLIGTRNSKKVIVPPPIILGDFIPFYFGVRMPMLYVAQIGGNFVKKVTPPEDIVYLVCSPNTILNSGNTFYFSDGHATDNFTTFYDQTKVHSLPQIIDWKSVKESYWAGAENLDLKRKKQAEFLVKDDIPSKYLHGFVCYNELAKQKLINMGVKQVIKVRPDCYY